MFYHKRYVEATHQNKKEFVTYILLWQNGATELKEDIKGNF